MREVPILFSAPMIRALLDGRKTQTRRILKPQPDTDFIHYDADSNEWYCDRGQWHKKRRWTVGDRLWVREACACACPDAIIYKANLPESEWALWKWRPSIHMPRWACRITLDVTRVWVERLQDISCADAIAEGICPAANSQTIDCDTPDPRKEYAALWDKINGAGSWDANPWIVATEFRRTPTPEARRDG